MIAEQDFRSIPSFFIAAINSADPRAEQSPE
jgi:hypothetical protein